MEKKLFWQANSGSRDKVLKTGIIPRKSGVSAGLCEYFIIGIGLLGLSKTNNNLRPIT